MALVTTLTALTLLGARPTGRFLGRQAHRTGLDTSTHVNVDMVTVSPPVPTGDT